MKYFFKKKNKIKLDNPINNSFDGLVYMTQDFKEGTLRIDFIRGNGNLLKIEGAFFYNINIKMRVEKGCPDWVSSDLEKKEK